ncbi:MAG: bifunctional sulfate adenylyltransferase/adenylylsulfate kinase [Gammaproteobacteria bacterium]|nr:bifunctional sulfate adenylyltransferase/adenylylsulfate kinase [Gammaproteobacteria bacterium]
MGAFKEPHGGELKDLYLPEGKADLEKEEAKDYASWDLTQRQICDLDLLMNGAFSPLEGFLGQEEYESVCQDMRLASGVLWPMPITLDVTEAFAGNISAGDSIALRDMEGVLLAIMQVSDIWTPDRSLEARQVFGTTDDTHPAVGFLMHESNPVYLGGKIQGIEPPTYYDFKLLRDTPSELRGRFRKLGWRRIVAFQTRNPLHRAHQELTFRAAREADANLLIQPVVGMTRAGDIDHFTRVRCYEHVLEEYPEQTTQLSLLNLAMRMGGPRETLWHAIIRKNYGCTHFIVGRDHAGPGNDKNGNPFYGPYDAQELFTQHEEELDIAMVPFKMMVYVENKAEYMPADAVEPTDKVLNLSGTEFRRRLQEGLEIPEWFSYPKVVEELRKGHPPKHLQGFTVFFTGLSGSGKSTIANALMVKLLEIGSRPVTLLDGDIVRKNLSSELNFSKEHRDLNIQRIGFVASEITKNGGIAICAPIAPYTTTRRQVRKAVSDVGGFIEVHVATPLEVCEKRDRKGLYVKARAGLIKGFTGIDDPYEVPENAEVVIDTNKLTPDLAAHRILITLEKLGYIR